MKHVLGILVLVLALYGLILASDPNARTLQNHQRIAERLALYGMLTLGVGVLIISGGIDLSIGSVFALAAVALGLLLSKRVPVPQAVAIVLGGAMLIGLFHGLLVTRLGLQPFIVTLCGLFIYRGLAYWLALPDPLALVRGLLRFLSAGLLFAGTSTRTGSAGNVGIGERSKELADFIYLSSGYPEVPVLVNLPVWLVLALAGVTAIGFLMRTFGMGRFPSRWLVIGLAAATLTAAGLRFSYLVNYLPVRLLLLLSVAALVAILLHFSVYGRYIYAIGANEQAARYAGIATRRYKVLAYVICSVLAAVGGMLELLDLQTASPSNTGNYYELYAITGAVLGGCSLRGGEGTVVGMILGTAVLPLLRNLINFSDIPEDLTFTVIGFALLLGTIVDELLKRRAARK